MFCKLPNNPAVEPLFTDSGNRYNYAPCSIVEHGMMRVWYCRNRRSGEIIDFIYLRQLQHRVCGPPLEILGPGPDAWDGVHVCDPCVVRGRYRFQGTLYRWALFYLGCDRHDNNHNQLGVALARHPAGPYLKWPGNPLVPYTRTDSWGTGQPSGFSLDGKGRLLLSYSLGTSGSSGVMCRVCDLSDMDRPVLGPEIPVHRQGLTNRDGAPSWAVTNADLVFDAARRLVYMVYDRLPKDTEDPSFIVSELQIAALPYGDLIGSTGAWHIIGNVTPAGTGWPRNHNSALVRTPEGHLPEPGRLRVHATRSMLAPFPACLWTYRLFEQPIRL